MNEILQQHLEWVKERNRVLENELYELKIKNKELGIRLEMKEEAEKRFQNRIADTNDLLSSIRCDHDREGYINTYLNEDIFEEAAVLHAVYTKSDFFKKKAWNWHDENPVESEPDYDLMNDETKQFSMVG